MTFRKIFVFTLMLNLLAVSFFAQTPKNDCLCPVIKLTEPSAPVKSGETATFTAQVNGDKGQTIYNWSVSGGSIIEGQGTPTIKVDTSGLEGATVTATVEIRGWCPTCDNMTASGTTIVVENPQARLFERMENPNCEYRQMIMDNYFVQLNNDPNTTGYIFTFGSPRRVADTEKKMRANLKWRNYDSSRIVFVNGGGRSKKPTIDFWLVPAGAEAPIPEPPVENQVDFDKTENNSEVETDPKEPYIFSAEYYDGGGCIDDNQELDIEGFAQKLKENPKARGNIVIMLMSKTELRKKEREVLKFLTAKGIARKRLKTFYINSFGGVELWLLP